jgi:hypothetical protein
MRLASVFQPDPANEFATSPDEAMQELGWLNVEPDVFAALLPEVLAGNGEVLAWLQGLRPTIKRLCALMALVDLHSAEDEANAALELNAIDGREGALVRAIDGRDDAFVRAAIRYTKRVGEFSEVPR